MSTSARIFAISHVAALTLLVLTACSGCAHTGVDAEHYPVAPPTSGFAARIHSGRTVRCVIDGQLSEANCQVVEQSMRKFNVAVGFDLFNPHAERVSVDEAKFMLKMDPEHTRDVTYVIGTELPTGNLGVTQFAAPHADGGVRQTPDEDHYLHTEIIGFAPCIWDDANEAAHVTTHELGHSVGMMHAEQQGAEESIMEPYFYPGAVTTLTPGDITSLRAAYN